MTMKKTFLVLIMSAFATIAFANDNPVDFGLNFKYSMPRSDFEALEGIDDFKDEFRAENGYSGGAFLRFNKNKLFLQGEATFSFKKSTFDYVLNIVTKNSVIKTKTLDVPIFAGYNIINSKAFKIKAFTGPTLSWLLDYDADAKSVFEAEPTNFNWLWSVGAGVDVAFLSFDVRYGFDVNGRKFDGSMQDSFKQKTNMLTFTLGWRIF